MIKIDLLKNHPSAIPAIANIWHDVLGGIWMPEIGIEEIEQNASAISSALAKSQACAVEA